MIRRVLFWLVWNVPIGPLAPWVLGLALGGRPRRVKRDEGVRPDDQLVP